MPPRPSRRAFLGAVGGATVALAGCLRSGTSPAGSHRDLPLADRQLPVAYDTATLREATLNGGPGKDGIPSIDDPSFVDATAADAFLDPGDVVFGLVGEEGAKAYPQHVLVWHEIANDTVDGRPVSVTYCPLTGTAMGFERGETTFGVSGDLVNSNLVMYDRATDSRWPQMLATAIEGTHEGDSLREFRLYWTTWDRWRTLYPETRVLSEDTGYARNYGVDPYGQYNPAGGYYTSNATIFRPLARDDRYPPKEPFLVSHEGAPLAVRKELLEARGVVASGDRLAVSDPELGTGRLYANPEERAFSWADGTVRGPDGEYAPDGLPLSEVLAFDAMWFAWAGFYPETRVHG